MSSVVENGICDIMLVGCNKLNIISSKKKKCILDDISILWMLIEMFIKFG